MRKNNVENVVNFLFINILTSPSGIVTVDLKRNDYTPDKIIFPQEESADLNLQSGNSTKESEATNSVRLML